MDHIFRNKVIFTAIIAIAIATVTYFFWPRSHTAGASKFGGNHAGVPVTIFTVEKSPITLQENLPGRVVPCEIAEIRPQVSGIITQRLFVEGSEVQEGQQLYQIDPTPYHAAYSKAEADLAKAHANVKLLRTKAQRYNKLVNANSISRQDYEDISAQLAQAEADVGIAKAMVETAQINLAYTKVYAPISGYIGKSEVTKGALVTANQATAITRITKLDPIYVDLTQSSQSSDLLMQLRHKINNSQENPIHLILENKAKPYKHAGKLQFIDVTVNQTTGSLVLRGIFANPERELLPGMFVRAQVNCTIADAILLPQQAVIRSHDGSANVWLIDADTNKAHLKPIAVERSIGDKWLISSGVSAGDSIVLEGFQKLVEGASVLPTQ